MAPSDSPSPPTGPDLRDAVARARSHGRFLSALRGLYRHVDLQARRRGPRCRACGQCCRFDRAGHRLYASTGELAMLTAAPPPAGGHRPPLRCAYQAARRCSAGDRRPLGCRVFFCDGDLQAWVRDRYERFHRRIRRLHQACGVPYAYVEVTAATSELLGLPDARGRRR